MLDRVSFSAVSGEQKLAFLKSYIPEDRSVLE